MTNKAMGGDLETATVEPQVRLQDVFSIERIVTEEKVASTKRLFEILSEVFARTSSHYIKKDQVFSILVERERLGSTSVGNGILMPHGRLPDLDTALGAIVRIREPARLDASDDKPIVVACGLLVPEQCAQVHIQLLARLARGFELGHLRDSLVSARTHQDMYQTLITLDEHQDQTS